jgi:putative membrane protein
MTGNFTEHSANERTFLAWIRTGIAVVGFGFVIEKFNLFILAVAASASADASKSIRIDRLSGPIGRYEGLAFMLAGILLIALGYWRFFRNERFIEDHTSSKPTGARAEIVVSGVLILLVAGYCLTFLTG